MKTKHKDIVLGILLLLYLIIAVPFAATPALLLIHFVGGCGIPILIGCVFCIFVSSILWIVGLHHIIEWLKSDNEKRA